MSQLLDSTYWYFCIGAGIEIHQNLYQVEEMIMNLDITEIHLNKKYALCLYEMRLKFILSEAL